MHTGQIVYFDKPGASNTDAVIDVAARRLQQGDLRHVVIASTTGATARQLCAALPEGDFNLVVVGSHTGFWGGDTQKMEAKTRRFFQEQGIPVFLGSHALSGVARSVSSTFGGVSQVEIIAHTLRRFGGEGIKVAVEVAVMAADAGLIPTDDETLAIGGTSRGCDTAVVLQAAHQNNFFELEIREILAKPRQRGSD
jgi:uncharacterized protein